MPSTAEKAEFDESFWYHVGVLVSQARLYLTSGESTAASANYAAADALFEILLVRMRSFDSFFRATGSQGDDALPTDFVPTWPSHGYLVGDERRKISKRLAHFTYAQPAQHEWPVGEMIKRCLEAIEEFLGAVNPLSARWQERKDEVRAFLDGEFAANDLTSIWTETDKHAHRRRLRQRPGPRPQRSCAESRPRQLSRPPITGDLRSARYST